MGLNLIYFTFLFTTNPSRPPSLTGEMHAFVS